MSWWEYVERHAPGWTQVDIARAAEVSSPTVSRWASGKQGVDPLPAARLARAFGRPVLEAFIAAGYLTAAEAGERPQPAPSLDQLTDDQLLAEMRARLQELRHGQPAPTSHAASGRSDSPPVTQHEPGTVQGEGRSSGETTPTPTEQPRPQ